MHTTHHRIVWLWAAPGYVLPFQLVCTQRTTNVSTLISCSGCLPCCVAGARVSQPRARASDLECTHLHVDNFFSGEFGLCVIVVAGSDRKADGCVHVSECIC